MHLLTQNSKIKKSKKNTWNFGIPALKSSTGAFTCPNAGICANGCYAQSGAYRFSNVALAFEKRLALTQTPAFEKLILNELNRKRVERLRIHDSGDFYLTDRNGKLSRIKEANTHTHYLDRWISIMLLAPKVEFYAYTKQVELFKHYESAGVLPRNFTVIYSYGGQQDALINPAVDRHARVFETVEQLRAAHYADASDNDDIALEKNFRIGLVYHGNKGFNKTSWDRATIVDAERMRHDFEQRWLKGDW